MFPFNIFLQIERHLNRPIKGKPLQVLRRLEPRNATSMKGNWNKI